MRHSSSGSRARFRAGPRVRFVRPVAAVTTIVALLALSLAPLASGADRPQRKAMPLARTATSRFPESTRRAAMPDSIYVRDLVRWLADPKREGRGPGTVGLDSSATYLAREMARLDLTPAGDSGGYLQKFQVTTGAEAKPPSGLEAGGRRFDLGDDFQPLGFSSNGTVTAPVVFAGYGITAAGYDYDDYAGLVVHD